MINDRQRTELRSLRKSMAANTDHYEIAPTVITDNGSLWVWFDHGRFVIFPDGTYGLTAYGKQRFYGLVIGELKRPTDNLTD